MFRLGFQGNLRHNTIMEICLDLNFELPSADSSDSPEPPQWIPLVPAGAFRGRDGREWVNNRPDDIVQAFIDGNTAVPLDEEHATELQAPSGLAAPAAGFITELQNRDGAIWGKVAWNATGEALVKGERYKYYSPAFYHQQGAVIRVSSVGLTNKPNLSVPALNNEQGDNSVAITTTTLPTSICEALGLNTDASEQSALAAVKKLQADLGQALNRAEQPPLEKFVPVAEYQTALNRAEQAEQALAARDKADFEAKREAILAKVPPANREGLKALCRTADDLPVLEQVAKNHAPLTEAQVSSDTPNATPGGTLMTPPPAGNQWDADSVQLDNLVMNHMRQHGCTYEQALQVVAGGV